MEIEKNKGPDLIKSVIQFDFNTEIVHGVIKWLLFCHIVGWEKGGYFYPEGLACGVERRMLVRKFELNT